jgi:hypothetical protein
MMSLEAAIILTNASNVFASYDHVSCNFGIVVIHPKTALAGKVDHLLGLKQCDCVMNNIFKEAEV